MLLTPQHDGKDAVDGTKDYIGEDGYNEVTMIMIMMMMKIVMMMMMMVVMENQENELKTFGGLDASHYVGALDAS